MIDIKNLTPKQVEELEKQIEEYKKSEKCLDCYKVTFYVKFNPHKRKEGSDLNDCEAFAGWVEDAFCGGIVRSFDLRDPEGVSVVAVSKVEPELARGIGTVYALS